MDESKYYEALGLTPPTPEAQEPAAEPAPEGQAAAAEVEAGTVESGGDHETEPDQGGGGSDAGVQTGADGGKQEQTAEERRANAARRRRQEQQVAVEAAVQQALEAEREKHKTELAALFAAAGMKNTKTGAPITTLEEFNTWKAEIDAAKVQADLKAGKLTPEGLNAAISQHPAIKQAQEIIRREEQAQREQETAAAQAKISAELVEIGKLDPSIKEVKDLLNMPNAKEFYELVKRGYTYLDAYHSVNRERLQENAVAAARQQAMTNARGKDHLAGTGNVRGAGAATVPAEDMRIFRALMPNASEADIQAYYNKHKNQR